MKMKEVIKLTGLTDRAVRLYIEKELICPENEKSYTGRNNLNFPEKDVELLKKISTLRKAGFSISQIQSIQSNSEQAQLALNELLETKEKEQELNKKVIDALSPLRGRDGLDIDMISDSLENSVKNEEVPKADMKQSTGEFIERIVFLILSVFGIGIILFSYLPYLLYYLSEFRFPKLYFNKNLLAHGMGHLILLIPLIMLIVAFILHLKPKYTKKRIIRRIISSVLVVLSFLSIFITFPMASAVFHLMPPVCSQTSDPSNYLLLDDYVFRVAGKNILDLFPNYIPPGAYSNEYGTREFLETTKYYYIYEYVVDPSYDIVAEWQLPEEEYEKAKEDIFNREDEIVGTEAKGDWQLVHFTDDYKTGISACFDFRIFAYNDDTNTVRYIVSYCQDAARGTYKPYYYSLDW